MMNKRKYELKRRAERQEETRQRILDATVTLHNSVGALGTTISAVAEEAGVERLTVYRHFPDETALLTTATTYYLDTHPFPDPALWHEISDPDRRLHAGLTAAYAYHQQTEGMIGRLIQGLPYKPVICDALEGYSAYWRQVQQSLSEGWDTSDPALVAAAIGHALSFKTWHSLVREMGLSNEQAVDLMQTMVRSSAT